MELKIKQKKLQMEVINKINKNERPTLQISNNITNILSNQKQTKTN